MRRFFTFCLAVVIAVGIAGCGFNEANKSQKPLLYQQDMSKKELAALVKEGMQDASKEAEKQAEEGAPWATSSKFQGMVAKGPRVVIETNKGNIVIAMLPDIAPKTVDNFKKLANSGFYNGLKWHAVIAGQIIMGGDPLTRNPNANAKDIGTGGPGYTIKAEFSNLHNFRGTVGMARLKDPDSAGSQFYICLKPSPSLDGKFTIFGQVVEGIEVADQIKINDVMSKVYVKPED